MVREDTNQGAGQGTNMTNIQSHTTKLAPAICYIFGLHFFLLKLYLHRLLRRTKSLSDF